MGLFGGLNSKQTQYLEETLTKIVAGDDSIRIDSNLIENEVIANALKVISSNNKTIKTWGENFLKEGFNDKINLKGGLSLIHI